MNNKTALLNTFKVPAIILFGIVLYVALELLKQNTPAVIIAILVTILGSYRLFKETFLNLLKKRFALDYIAILAIVVSLITKEYLVASILALMISSGRTLEDYGVAQAKKSLTKLAERIPSEVILWEIPSNGTGARAGAKITIGKVKIGDFVLIRKGEVIGLDGILESEAGLTDESSLTGEPYTIEKIKGDSIRSGTINIGDPIVIKITKVQADSTYNKIIDMVKKAQDEKSPLVRMADKYSGIFTLVTLIITGFSYIYSGFDLTRALAVLAIATPCPLIIATPIALLGGVNSASKKHIIVKKLASIEILSRTQALIFDKTGTITLGKPRVLEFKNSAKNYTDKELLAIAESIERNSLHPLAKAIVNFAKEKNANVIHAEKIQEKVGVGISGTVNGEKYTLSKLKSADGMAIEILENNKSIGIFRFEDEIKQDSKNIITNLKKAGFQIFIFTGDKKEAADKVAAQLGRDVIVKAECAPEDKQKGIHELKKQGKITAMVGDGINDAPALALADVGMVFSNEEQTAASEAADIVFLGGNFSLVLDSLNIAKKTIYIAKQSIFWGIGISVLGMVLASFGLIPPIGGAFIQEAIDVAVIINALRASR
ncbi:MAG: cadmium-translocating P-type ATPase [Patescibacteria group bacterium]|nr:cadmium-translocating P-type ATPase [Patescibacteria group bacterium]